MIAEELANLVVLEITLDKFNCLLIRQDSVLSTSTPARSDLDEPDFVLA